MVMGIFIFSRPTASMVDPGGFSLVAYIINIPRESLFEVLPRVAYVGLVPRGEGAVSEFLNPARDPFKNRMKPPLSVGQLIISSAPGTSIYLDYFRFKNVVFINSSIQYDGGDLVMDNVRFVNCTFQKNR